MKGTTTITASTATEKIALWITSRGCRWVAILFEHVFEQSRRHSEVFDALDANLDRACELSFDVMTIPELLRMAGRLEKMARRLVVPGHALIQSARPASYR